MFKETKKMSKRFSFTRQSNEEHPIVEEGFVAQVPVNVLSDGFQNYLKN